MKNKKLKMAFVDLSNFVDWPMGGMLEYELRILKYMVDEYEIDLWGVSVDGKKQDRIFINGKAYKVNIFGNVKTKKRIIPNYWRGTSIFWQKDIFKNNDYDIVYSHLGSCMTALATMFNKNPKPLLVYQQHGLNYLYSHSIFLGIQKPFYKIAQKKSDLVFLVSDLKSANNFATMMKTKSKARFVGVGSPIDLKQFQIQSIKGRIEMRKNDKVHKFIYTGRISEEKQVAVLIKAFEIYQKKTGNLDSHLYIIGDGPDMQNVRNIVSKLNNSTIHLEGKMNHDDIYNVLIDADIFLTASRGEGCSVSVLEGLASGLPVVCFAAPGLEGQIQNGKTGIVVKEFSNEAFAQGMINAENEKYKMAYNCLEFVHSFDEKEISNYIVSHINKEYLNKNRSR